jgi:hypothetical protein
LIRSSLNSFCYLKNEIEPDHFTSRIIPEKDIKIETMDICKVSRLLFFEKKIERFIKGYEMKKAYSDSKKYCEEEGYNVLRNKTSGLRRGNVVNRISTTKNKTHYRYFLIRDSLKN